MSPAILGGMLASGKVTMAKINDSVHRILMYVTFRPNFHRFDRSELDVRGHTQVRGAAFACPRLKWADMVLI